MRGRAVLGTVVTLVAALGQLPTATASTDPWAEDPGQTATIEGDDTEIADLRFGPDGARHAVVSRSDKFPDALAATPLLGEGPLFYASPNSDNWWLPGTIDRVLPDGATVYILGGEAAVSSQVERDLRSRGFDVKRLAGSSRIETALAVAAEVERLYPDAAGEVLVARAFGPADDPDGTAAWADSVTAGGWAAATRHPVVLSPTDRLPPAVGAFLAGRTRATLLGGPSALSDAVADAARGRVPKVGRVAGSERAGTAADILVRLWKQDPQSGRRIVIDGWRRDAWQVGLPLAGLSADHRAPIVFVAEFGLPGPTAAVTYRCGDKGLRVLAAGALNPYYLGHLEAYDGIECPPATNPAPVANDRAITAIHLVPSDREPVIPLIEGARRELALVDQWFAGQTGWKGLSWSRTAQDEHRVDVVRIPERAEQLGVNKGVRAILDRLGYTGPALVYVEATGFGCGSTQADVAVIWMSACGHYPDLNTSAFPFGATWLAAHELTHLLGAVPSCAPNDDGAGHVTDDQRDILWPGFGSMETVLDAGRDDYFMHGRAGCPDIADSPLWNK